MRTYFTEDGSYGNAKGITIIDTTTWTEEDWDLIDDTEDSNRPMVATQISLARGDN